MPSRLLVSPMKAASLKAFRTSIAVSALSTSKFLNADVIMLLKGLFAASEASRSLFTYIFVDDSICSNCSSAHLVLIQSGISTSMPIAFRAFILVPIIPESALSIKSKAPPNALFNQSTSGENIPMKASAKDLKKLFRPSHDLLRKSVTFSQFFMSAIIPTTAAAIAEMIRTTGLAMSNANTENSDLPISSIDLTATAPNILKPTMRGFITAAIPVFNGSAISALIASITTFNPSNAPIRIVLIPTNVATAKVLTARKDFIKAHFMYSAAMLIACLTLRKSKAFASDPLISLPAFPIAITNVGMNVLTILYASTVKNEIVFPRSPPIIYLSLPNMVMKTGMRLFVIMAFIDAMAGMKLLTIINLNKAIIGANARMNVDPINIPTFAN